MHAHLLVNWKAVFGTQWQSVQYKNVHSMGPIHPPAPQSSQYFIQRPRSQCCPIWILAADQFNISLLTTIVRRTLLQKSRRTHSRHSVLLTSWNLSTRWTYARMSYVKTLRHDTGLHSTSDLSVSQATASRDEWRHWRVVCAGIDVDSSAATYSKQEGKYTIVGML